MKKRTIFLFILILVIGIFLTGCAKQEPGRGLSSLGDMMTGILEAVFGAISTSPTVWMKFMLFVLVFAALFGSIRKIPKIEEKIDEKTVGILSFVIALAAASLTSNAWLIALFSLFQGAVLAIIFLIAPVTTLFFTKWVWDEGKKEGHSTLWWFLVACAWILNLIIWANMSVVTMFIKGSLDKVDLGLGFAYFTEAMIGYISLFGLIFAIIMVLASGAWERAGLRSDRRVAHKKGKREMEGPGFIEQKLGTKTPGIRQSIFGGQELIEPSQGIKKIKDNINLAITKVNTKTAWKAPIKKAQDDLYHQMNAIINSRINAIRAYQEAFRIDPKRAKKGDINKMTTALAKVETQLNTVENELDKVLGFTGTDTAAITGRTKALNSSKSTLEVLRTKINLLDTEIHTVEASLK